MKMFLATLLVFGLAIESAMSQAATLGQFPSHAALTFPGRFCDATVLNNRHVLTAATCGLTPDTYERLPATVYSLFVGVINIPGPLTIAISHIYIHEHYTPFNQHLNNIAVFRTATDINLNAPPPAPLVEPVQFYNRIVADHQGCTLVGWNSPPQHLSTPLQHQIQNIVNRAQCNGLNEVMGNVVDSMVCAGSLLSNPIPCVNNPGGALYCNDRLFAIMSHNRRCGQTMSPGVYTQVRFYDEWIQQQFGRTDAPPPGPTHAPGHPLPPGAPGAASALKSSLFILLSLLALKLIV